MTRFCFLKHCILLVTVVKVFIFPCLCYCFLVIVPGSEKIRRIVEVLRADVIQGLGIQLLEQVYDLLEEEDELKREVSIPLAASAVCAIEFF